jgi:hypothetical protein
MLFLKQVVPACNSEMLSDICHLHPFPGELLERLEAWRVQYVASH